MFEPTTTTTIATAAAATAAAATAAEPFVKTIYLRLVIFFGASAAFHWRSNTLTLHFFNRKC